MTFLIDLWLRRNWRSSKALEAFAGMQPITVVTGASDGIGRQLALRFASFGNPVMLVARRAEPLEETARTIAAAGGTAFAVTADLATTAGCSTIDAALSGRRAYCDVLINAAAMGLSGPLVEYGHDDLLRLVDLNVRATSDLMHRHLPGMLTRGRGGIVNIASLGGYLPGPHQAAYYASKAYVISLTEAVAHECRGQGVRICVVSPGPVDTGFHAKMGADAAYYAAFAKWMSAAGIAKRTLRGFRWGQTVIVPGLPFRILSLIVRVLPHPILLPITGWLLKRRA